MVEMVDILVRTDYDWKHGPYRNPNARKAKIMAKVVRSLHSNFGVRRNKDQLWKCWGEKKRDIWAVCGHQYLLKIQNTPEEDVDADVHMLMCRKYCVKFSKLCPPQVMWMLWKTKLTSAVQVHRYLSVSSWFAIGNWRKWMKTCMISKTALSTSSIF